MVEVTGSVEAPIVVDLMNAQIVATMKTGERRTARRRK